MGIVEIKEDIDIKLTIYSVIVGLAVGIIISGFRKGLYYVSFLRNEIYRLIQIKGLMYSLVFIFIFLLLAMILGFLTRIVPCIKGSGVARIKDAVEMDINFSCIKEIGSKFFGSLLAIFLGFSLGRAGPAVQMGGTAGYGFGKLFKVNEEERKILLLAGVSAGMTVAFSAPIGGVLFVLEEVYKKLTPKVVLCLITSSISGYIITQSIFGVGTLFEFSNVSGIPIEQYGYIVLAGIIIGFLGKLIMILVEAFQKTILNEKHIKEKYIPIIVSLVIFIVGLYYPLALGGGILIINFTLSVCRMHEGMCFQGRLNSAAPLVPDWQSGMRCKLVGHHHRCLTLSECFSLTSCP